ASPCRISLRRGSLWEGCSTSTTRAEPDSWPAPYSAGRRDAAPPWQPSPAGKRPRFDPSSAGAHWLKRNEGSQMSDRRLTGKINSSGIGMFELPTIPAEIMEGFRALGADASSVVSDAMDELGVAKAIGASVLRPIYAPAAIVGRALTLRNIVQE